MLLLLPAIFRQQEQSAETFVPNAVAWLKALETALTAARLYQAGNVAALLSEFVAVQQGRLPAGLEFRGRPTRSRVAVALAAQTLQRAANLASSILAEHQPRRLEAERFIQEVVAAGVSRGLLAIPDDIKLDLESLRSARRNLGQSADLESALVHIEGLVGLQDLLVLLERAIMARHGGGV